MPHEAQSCFERVLDGRPFALELADLFLLALLEPALDIRVAPEFGDERADRPAVVDIPEQRLQDLDVTERSVQTLAIDRLEQFEGVSQFLGADSNLMEFLR